MPKKIKIKLSARSLNEAKEAIAQYRKELVEYKIKQFVESLSLIGEQTIENVLVGWVDTGDTLNSLEREFNESNAMCKCLIRVTSDAILFLEFGSGSVGLSSDRNPLEEEFSGYGPGKFIVKNDYDDVMTNGWNYYSEHSGRRGHTFGLPAVMPMYKGSKAMEKKILSVAKEVFGK